MNVDEPVNVWVYPLAEGGYIGRTEKKPYRIFRGETVESVIDQYRRYYSPGVVQFFRDGDGVDPFYASVTTKTEKREYA